MMIPQPARIERDFRSLPLQIQRRADKQLQLLIDNPRHPSLRIKKMEGSQDIWEGRITKGYRFTFQVRQDTYLLRRIGTHDILVNPYVVGRSLPPSVSPTRVNPNHISFNKTNKGVSPYQFKPYFP